MLSVCLFQVSMFKDSTYLNVIFQLRRYGYDRRAFCHSSLHELDNLLVLLLGLTFLHQVDLILQDEDVFQLHDLDGGEMLTSLWLGARLVTFWD